MVARKYNEIHFVKTRQNRPKKHEFLHLSYHDPLLISDSVFTEAEVRESEEDKICVDDDNLAVVSDGDRVIPDMLHVSLLPNTFFGSWVSDSASALRVPLLRF